MKIAVVISQLKQHGSEKMCYEFIKFFNDKGHHVVVYTGFNSRNDFYSRKISNLNIKIKYVLFSRRFISRLGPKFGFNIIKLGFIADLILYIHNLFFLKNLNSFDIVSSFGLDTYCDTIKYANVDPIKLRIHSVLHPYQYERKYYDEIPDGVTYISDDEYIINDLKKNINCEFNLIKIGNFINLNSFDLSKPKKKKNKYKSKNFLNIGIASRLAKDRPNKKIIELISSNSITNCNFIWYGSGDKNKFIKDNKLENCSVKFAGHSKDLSYQSKKDKIDIFIHVMHYFKRSYSP